MRESINRFYDDNPTKPMIHRAKTRARQKGLTFDLTDADLLPLPTHCPVLGIELRAGAEPRDYAATASIVSTTTRATRPTT